MEELFRVVISQSDGLATADFRSADAAWSCFAAALRAGCSSAFIYDGERLVGYVLAERAAHQ